MNLRIPLQTRRQQQCKWPRQQVVQAGESGTGAERQDIDLPVPEIYGHQSCYQLTNLDPTALMRSFSQIMYLGAKIRNEWTKDRVVGGNKEAGYFCAAVAARAGVPRVARVKMIKLLNNSDSRMLRGRRADWAVTLVACVWMHLDASLSGLFVTTE